MKKVTAILVSALLMMGMLTVLSGCGGKESAKQPAATEKVMKVVTEAGFAPFEFKESGEFVGFDIDIIKTERDKLVLGVDLGIRRFAVTSEGKMFVDKKFRTS